MPYKEGQPTLIECLVWPFTKIEVVKEDASGKPYVYLFEYYMILQVIFESGAVLGRAMCNKIDKFRKMLLIPPTKDDALEKATKAAKAIFDAATKESGNEPSNFGDFIHGMLFKEAIGLSLRDCAEVLMRDKKRFKEIQRTVEKKAQQKGSLSDNYDVLMLYGYWGIGFGIRFPELTEKMYRNLHENIDVDAYSKLRELGLLVPPERGLPIPEKPEVLSMEEREKELLQLLAAYTQEFYPELIDELELREYIDIGGQKGTKNG